MGDNKTRTEYWNNSTLETLHIRKMISELESSKKRMGRQSILRQFYATPQLPAKTKNQIDKKLHVLSQLRMNGFKQSLVSNEQLYAEYRAICCRLDFAFYHERERTQTEAVSGGMIASATKLKHFRSMWIGPVNIDFFVPAIRSKHGIGLAIEIDGSIHDKQFKMSKDQHKLDYLYSLGICTLVIENDDVLRRNMQALSTFEKLSKIKRACSRSRKILMRKIYLETIIAHSNFDDLEKFFGYPIFRI